MVDLLILLAVSLAVSAVGWKYFIYFFSLGYGYGVAALAVTMGVMYHGSLSVPSIALLVLLFVFGVRLGTYLFLRERKAAAYRKILYDPSLQKKKPVSKAQPSARLGPGSVPSWCSAASCSKPSAMRRSQPPRNATPSGLSAPGFTG